ncbi:MAG: DUF445 domain-containing protein [Limnochordia bacterium]|jgi:uncharacterized membrane protein YheB (UPF0754 family)|nr:DUF445 family protein [Bacillota bacterium]
MEGRLLLIPFIGAGIGWLTNVVAIRMLFRPKVPIKVGGITVQGILPKRQKELAKAIALAVEKELLPLDNLLGRIRRPEFLQQLTTTVVSHVDRRIRDGLPGFLPAGLRHYLADMLREVVSRETSLLIGEVSGQVTEQIRQEAQVGELVEAKVNAFDLDQLESLVVDLASNELKHIELMGALLGFIVGLGQLLIAVWLI